MRNNNSFQLIGLIIVASAFVSCSSVNDKETTALMRENTVYSSDTSDGVSSETVESICSSELSTDESDVTIMTSQYTTNAERLMIEYKEALMNLYEHLIWPVTRYYLDDNDRVAEFMYGKKSDNAFAIVDVDRDGRDELIIRWTTAALMSWCYTCEVFEYDVENNKWRSEGFFNPDGLEFYDNGIVFNLHLHNQNYGDTVYPYSIVEYNKEDDKYVFDESSGVFCLDKPYFQARSEKIPDWFREIDVEKKGVVYSITYRGYDSDRFYSQSDYDKFINDLIGKAKKVDIQFLPLTKKNIEAITK